MSSKLKQHFLFLCLLILISISICSSDDDCPENNLGCKSNENSDQCIIYSTIEDLRKSEYGDNSQSYIYGMGAFEARKLYHNLLPSCLLKSENYSPLDTCQKAKLAYDSRKAAKIYVREKSNILVSMKAKLFDFYRYQNTDGENISKFWNRKCEQLIGSVRNDESIDDDKSKLVSENIRTYCVIDEKWSRIAKKNMFPLEREKNYKLWNVEHCSQVCELILQSSLVANKMVNDYTGYTASKSSKSET